MDIRTDKRAFEAYMIKSKMNNSKKKKKSILFQPLKVVNTTKRKGKEFDD